MVYLECLSRRIKYVTHILLITIFLSSLASSFACKRRGTLSTRDTPVTPAEQQQLRLQVEETSLHLGFSQRKIITVDVFDIKTNQPVPNVAIAFDVESGGAHASVAQNASKSNLEGRVQNTLVAGQDKGDARVRIHANNASDVFVSITVDGTYTGRLVVRYQVSGTANISNVITKLYRTDRCDALTNASSGPTTMQPVNQRTAPNASSQISFDNLTENTVYAVTASGLDNQGGVGASGCVVTPAIVGQNDVTAVVPMTLRTPVFVGT